MACSSLASNGSSQIARQPFQLGEQFPSSAELTRIFGRSQSARSVAQHGAPTCPIAAIPQSSRAHFAPTTRRIGQPHWRIDSSRRRASSPCSSNVDPASNGAPASPKLGRWHGGRYRYFVVLGIYDRVERICVSVYGQPSCLVRLLLRVGAVAHQARKRAVPASVSTRRLKPLPARVCLQTGAVAQLAERYVRNVQARGSIPLSSTPTAKQQQTGDKKCQCHGKKQTQQ